MHTLEQISDKLVLVTQKPEVSYNILNVLQGQLPQIARQHLWSTV